MPQIEKFDGYLVNPQQASDVVTPAYDAMTPKERREFAELNPGNYVNVMRSLEEFDQDRPTLEEILQHNLSSLEKLFEKGAFIRTESPAYYLYQLRCGSHEQTGVIANIPVEDYTTGRLKKHEDTQLEKESMLTRYHQTVGVTSSPICVAYPDRGDINDAVHRTKLNEPFLKLQAWDDVEQTVWRVADADLSAQLESGFNQIEYTYLTDGHHRCASGARYADLVRKNASPDSDPMPGGQLLVSLFPESELRIYSYFRCVRDLGQMGVDEFVNAVGATGIKVDEIGLDNGTRLLPKQARNIAMIVDNRAFHLRIPQQMVPVNDPVSALDVSILQTEILSKILGIHDARSDQRLSYTPGNEGISSLLERCQQGWRVGFACVDTTMQEVVDVADAKGVMPPKSTWFDPKLRAGLFLRYC